MDISGQTLNGERGEVKNVDGTKDIPSSWTELEGE